jgi:hypothetical protein
MSSSSSGLPKVFRFMLGLPLLLIVGLPLAVIGGIFTGYVYAGLILGACRLKMKMTKSHRAISMSSLRAKVEAGLQSGTLIFESYTLGWPVARLWWTPDSLPLADASQIAPRGDDGIEQASSPEQQWVYDTYAEVEKGNALLVDAWVGSRTFAKRRSLFPNITVVDLWSGAILMKRRIDAKRLTGGTSGTDPSTSSG